MCVTEGDTMSETQTCTVCGADLHLSAFYKDARRTSGLRSECKRCVLERNKRWYSRNRSAVLEYQAQYHKDQRRTDPAKVAAGNAAWKAANPDLVRADNRRRRARKLNAEQDGHTHAELLAHWAANAIDAASCWLRGPECTGNADHIDHVEPLARGGAHTVQNLRPACARCNLSKSDKTLEEWRA